MSAANSGSSTLTADSCAGCHRAHTAQGAMLINAPTEEALCLTCHGAAGTGATTDVMTGIQYAVGTGATVRGTTQLGALRGGGFDMARISTGDPSRLTYMRSATETSQRPKVGVTSAWPVSSSHLDLDGAGGVSAVGIAWGNGAAGSGAGPTVSLSCASCHNPHGNGQFRILNAIPSAGGLTAVAAPGVTVNDASPPSAGDARNYTVMQTKGTEGTESTYLLYASQVATAASTGTFNGIAGDYGPTGGDYFARSVPWNPVLSNPACNPLVSAGSDNPTNQAACATAVSAPNGRPTTFSGQITAWCSSCHTRYFANTNPNPGGWPGPNGGTPATASSWWFPRPGDDLYKYQHRTVSGRDCLTCHVSHGSDANLTGSYSLTMPYPDGTVHASSRLLKVNNRGTCQMCHDPTATIAAGTYLGPVRPLP